MNRRRRLRGSVFFALLSAAASLSAHAAEPTDGQGNIGRTSYLTMPFVSQVYADCWACSSYLEPGELYFQYNPNSFFNNASMMATARYGAQAQENAGVLPVSGQQRWEDTYAASFPAGTFPNAPSYVNNDRNTYGFSTDGAFIAWRNFITNHPQYWDVAFDGGTMPSESTYFRSWGGQWGFISPLTPLDAVDCPAGMAACNWGQVWAAMWAKSEVLSGAYNTSLSDFGDSQPDRTTNYHNFNARIVNNFIRATNLPVPPPSAGVAAQAKWIVTNASPAWNDFLAQGYASFFATLSATVGTATGKKSLVIDQCGWSPSYRRWFGTDQRLIANALSPSLYICLWDDQMIQQARSGPVINPPTQEIAGYTLAAAREPLMRNGANIEADDAAYWASIAQFYPSLSATAQKEVGYKLLKRLWLWSSWAHIADRSGNVRRAIAFASRDYWDAGTLTASALGNLTTLIQTIYPAKPFGPAVYYSTAVERAREQQQGAIAGVGSYDNYYLAPAILQAFIDGGGGAGYYISDAALGTIVAGSANAPSAWVVLDDQGQMPASERSQLAAIAPVVSTPAALAALPNQPILFTGGLTGFSFYDQSNRLIIVVTNPNTQPTAGTVAGAVNLSGLTGASYTVTDLFANTTTKLTPSNGKASLPVTATRWDSFAFAVTQP